MKNVGKVKLSSAKLKRFFLFFISAFFAVIICCSVFPHFGKPSLQEHEISEANKKFGIPKIDNSLPKRRIVLVDQVDAGSSVTNGWRIHCIPPKHGDHWEVRLMSAQKFLDGKRDGLSIFFTPNGKQVLMAGEWRNDAPWEGDFYVQPNSGNLLITNGYSEDYFDSDLRKEAARFVKGESSGLAKKNRGIYSEIFNKKLNKAVGEIYQLTENTVGEAFFKSSIADPLVAKDFPQGPSFRKFSPNPVYSWQWNSKAPPRKLAILEECKKGTKVPHGWTLMQYFYPEAQPAPKLMSAQHFSNGDLEGFSFFFDRKGALQAIGEWKNGKPFQGDFPLRLLPSRMVLITDGFWGGTFSGDLFMQKYGEPVLQEPLFGTYEEGKFVRSSYMESSIQNNLLKNSRCHEKLDEVRVRFDEITKMPVKETTTNGDNHKPN